MALNPIGVDPNFKQENELVRPTDVGPNNLVRLKRGSLYAVGLTAVRVFDQTNYTDLKVSTLDPDATAVSQQTVYKHLQFPNGLNEDVYVTYYIFDDSLETERAEFTTALESLDVEVGSPDYRAVIDKPYALGAKPHDHHASNSYGLQAIAAALLTLLNQSNRNLDAVLSEVLKGTQSGFDNRLKTASKSIVGAINEIFSTLDSLDISIIQQNTSSGLNTSDKSIVGAINELKAKVNALTSLLEQGIVFSGELSGPSVTLTTSDHQSRIWGVTDDVEITANFVNNVTAVNAASGDIVFLDGITQQYHHQNVGGLTASMLDSATTVAESGMAITDTLLAILGGVSALSGINPLNPLLGIIVANTDYSAAPANKTGFYLIGKNGLSVTFGNPGQTLNLTVGSTVSVTEGSFDYTVDSAVSGMLLPELSDNMPDTGRVKVIDAYNDLTALVQHTVSTYGNGIDYAGVLTAGSYDLTSATGTKMWAIGQPCTVTITTAEGDLQTDVEPGDLVVRKQSSGKFFISRIGSYLAGKADGSDASLQTTSKTLIGALLEIIGDIPTKRPVKIVDDLPVDGSGRYLLPNVEDVDDRTVWILKNGGRVFGEWSWIDDPYGFTFNPYTVICYVSSSPGGWSQYTLDNAPKGVLNLLDKVCPMFTGDIKTVAGEINRIRQKYLSVDNIETGDVIITGELKSTSYALPCDGKIHKTVNYPTLSGLLRNLYGGDGVIEFGLPDVPFKMLDVSEKLVTKTYHDGIYTGSSDRNVGGSGELAFANDGLITVSVNHGNNGVLVRDNVTRGITEHTMLGTLYINAVAAVPNKEYFYLLVHIPPGEVDAGNHIYVFDPLFSEYPDKFTRVYTGMLNEYGVIVVDSDDSDLVYQCDTLPDNRAQLYRSRMGTVDAPVSLPNSEAGINPKRLCSTMVGRVISWVLDSSMIAQAYNVDTTVLTTENLPVIGSLDATALPYHIQFSPTKGLFGVTFVSNDGSDKNYQRSVFWLDFQISPATLIHEQSFDFVSGEALSFWTSVVCAESNPVSDECCLIVRNGVNEYLAVTESRLLERSYIKT